jgi:peptidoglycan/xylan/chitin deacetylase (PgdA/CDA1 family)
MKLTSVVILVMIVAWCVARAEEGKGTKPQVIILKLDDMCTHGAKNGAAVSPRWLKVIAFLEEHKMKASIGIHGFSLEGDNEEYFNYLKGLNKKGFEFWNHGYKNRTKDDVKGEFELDSVEEQKASLEKVQKLAKEKLGVELKAFGPHWSATNESSDKALESVPEIKYVFFYGPKDKKASSKIILERNVNLENPTFVPDFDKFKAAYEKAGTKKEYIVLQGHPNQWDDKRFAGFEEIVDYLVTKGCVFMTCSGYYDVIKAGKGT